MNASETTNCGTEMTGVAYVMIDADRISSRIFPDVRMFCIQDEIDVGITRRIIGYCVPLQSYETEFEAAPEPTRLIIPNKAVDNQFVDTFRNYYKFKIRPIFVVPSDANAFQQMSRSAPPQLRDHRILKASAICIRTDMEPILMRRVRPSQVSKSLLNKFRLGRNPHLVPLRLPSGAECYLLLDLAEHCRDIYSASKEPEFAHYHFRELQIEDAKTLAAEAAVVAEVSNTNAEVRSSPNSVAECSTAEQRPGTTVAECSTAEQRPGTSEGTNNDDNMTSPPIKPLTYAQATANGPRRNAASTSNTKSFQKLSEVAGGPELNDGLSSRTPEQQRQRSAEENFSPNVSSESSAKALEVSLSPVPTPPPARLPFSYAEVVTRPPRRTARRNGSL
uniref:CABIT domain-containing protein n=1 Tax=Globodera rostochiensis TaxID=31243 RepID=A0A914ID33_GLORO